MEYTVLISPAAQRQIKKLIKNIQQQIISKLQELRITPRPQGVEKLWSDKELYRVRTGDYRIIYQINDVKLEILVLKVGHRSDVYRRI